MKTNTRQQKVKVVWQDAVIFGSDNIPTKLAIRETRGYLLKEDKNYILIAKPKTDKPNQSKLIKVLNFLKTCRQKKPTYFFIPRGMILKIKKIPT
jgi:hypothetical protein